MLRFKKWIAGIGCLVIFTVLAVSSGIENPAAKDEEYSGGWLSKLDHRILDRDLTWSVPEGWKGSGKGQTRLLNEDYIKVHGHSYVPRDQKKAPSCVGHANAAAIDFLAAVQVAAGGERAPPALSSAEVIYGLSRIEIGGKPIGSKGGSHNLWAVRALKEYGSVANLNYGLLGYDLREPSTQLALEFGSRGVPEGLERIAKLHPIDEYISIDSYAELRDAVYNGCPVVVGSNQGFGSGHLRRDGGGFLVPPRRFLFPSRWNHSMVCIGVCDSGREGALILNSWGSDWVSGPKRFDSDPEGSFWVDKAYIERMVRQGDTFAIRAYRGYPSYKLFDTPKYSF